MNRNRTDRLSFAWVPLFALLVLAGAGFAWTDDEEPMTEEEVVRLWVAKIPTRDLLKSIRSRPAAFALDPEMLDELRTAGLPRELIEAMVSRQKEFDLASGEVVPESATGEPTEIAETLVRFVLAGDAEKPIVLSAPKELSREWIETLSVRDPEATVEDVGIYVACLNPPYVPDRWRSQSPLGRDFNGVPRHRMLAFHSGADVHKDGVRLTVPPELAFELAEAPPWVLEIGVAWRVSGRFYRISHANIAAFEPVAGSPIVVELAQGTLHPVIRIASVDAGG